MECMRPDLAYTIHQLSEFNSNPTNAHFQPEKQVIRYIQGSEKFWSHVETQRKDHHPDPIGLRRYLIWWWRCTMQQNNGAIVVGKTGVCYLGEHHR